MNLIDRYLFRQLLGPALLASVSLSAVTLLTQSLQALDLIVNQGQSAAVFLKITLLSLPSLVSLVLPIAIFIASLVALNRLQTEQELVVCFAGGMSRWRVISPVIRLGVLAALLSLVLNLWLQPLCARAMREELFKVRTDLASILVQPGRFTEPTPGLTVYASDLGRNGTIHNLFVDQEKPGGASVTFSAKEGVIAQRDGMPVLIMRKGSQQELTKAGVLNYLAFDENTLELGPYLPKSDVVHYKISDRYLHELLFPDLTQVWEQQNRLKLYAEAHARLAGPLYNIALVTIALWAVLGGAFSRLGYGRRIMIAGAVMAVVRVAGVGMQAVADDNAWLNVLQYVVPVAATAWGLSGVFHRPRRARARPPAGGLAPRAA